MSEWVDGWMGGWVDRMMIIITRDGIHTGVWNTVTAGMSWRTLLGSYTSTSAEEQQQQPRRDNKYKQAAALLVESCEMIQLAVVL